MPGGIYTYSRLPVTRQVDHIFDTYAGVEYYVNKGVVYTEVQLASGQAVHVFNCHPGAPISMHEDEGCEAYDNCTLQTVRLRQLKQLREIHHFRLSLDISNDDMVLFAGDFNINRYTALWETSEMETPKTASMCCGEDFYRMLQELHAEHPRIVTNPLADAAPLQGAGHNGVFTWDGSENAITNNVAWPKSFSWIDYVLFSTDHHQPTYADNMVIRLKLPAPVYEQGPFYRDECVTQREAWIEAITQGTTSPMATVEHYAGKLGAIHQATMQYQLASGHNLVQRISELLDTDLIDKDSFIDRALDLMHPLRALGPHSDDYHRTIGWILVLSAAVTATNLVHAGMTEGNYKPAQQLSLKTTADAERATWLQAQPNFSGEAFTRAFSFWSDLRTAVLAKIFEGTRAFGDMARVASVTAVNRNIQSAKAGQPSQFERAEADKEVRGPAFWDVSDHYGVLGRFVLASVGAQPEDNHEQQQRLRALMANRIDPSREPSWLHGNRVAQPAAFGFGRSSKESPPREASSRRRNTAARTKTGAKRLPTSGTDTADRDAAAPFPSQDGLEQE